MLRPRRAQEGVRHQVKDVGEPCEGKPHARFEAAAGGNQRQSATAAPGLPSTLPLRGQPSRTVASNRRLVGWYAWGFQSTTEIPHKVTSARPDDDSMTINGEASLASLAIESKGPHAQTLRCSD